MKNQTASSITEDTLRIDLPDGRTISVPLAWYPRLVHATREERDNWELIGEGQESDGPTWTKTSVSRDSLRGVRLEKASAPSSDGSKRNERAVMSRCTT